MARLGTDGTGGAVKYGWCGWVRMVRLVRMGAVLFYTNSNRNTPSLYFFIQIQIEIQPQCIVLYKFQ